MFIELMPLLAGRTVLITVAKVDDKTIRINVIPALAKADENPALTTPLTYTGPPEEHITRFRTTMRPAPHSKLTFLGLGQYPEAVRRMLSVGRDLKTEMLVKANLRYGCCG